jgi:hypothetical protein
MWPFSEMSLSAATIVATLANWVLLTSLLGGVLATFVIVKTTDVKEDHWAEDRRKSNEHIAQLNNDTERLRGDNLALQTALQPRHIGLIGIDKPPPAEEWFAGFEAFAGTEMSIQFVPDPEAQNLANEIAIVLSRFGWRPQFIDGERSHLPAARMPDGVQVSYPIGKPWTAEEPVQAWFAWNRAAEALADALTKAGLGVGEYPVSRYGFLNNKPDIPGSQAFFEPPLTGVYLQVGARPVAFTVEWIKRGRPDRAGIPPADRAPPKTATQK